MPLGRPTYWRVKAFLKEFQDGAKIQLGADVDELRTFTDEFRTLYMRRVEKYASGCALWHPSYLQGWM